MAQLAETRATKAYQERLIIIVTISKKISKTLGINRGGKGQREKVILLVFIIYNYNYYKSYCL